MNKVIRFPQEDKKNNLDLLEINSSLIRKIAHGLMIKLRINPDALLIYVLGSGNESSNVEAVETWLKRYVGVERIVEMDSPLEVISTELQKYLDNIGDEL